MGEEEYYRKLINSFFVCAICEHLGANKEYIRVNDAIRDYVLRTKHDIEPKFKENLKNHLKNFLKTYQTEEKDVSDFFISMKEALLSGEDIDDKYLIPSHFLSTMKELYDQYKRYDDVVKLADRVLQHESYMDDLIIFQIRYYLCLALAKLRDNRFKEEVMKIEGPEHNFLFGFYYRLLGKNIEAIERLTIALKERKIFPRAKRELVQAYVNIEAYEEALDLAKQNYIESKNNPYHIQAYFTCLSRSDKNLSHESTIVELLHNLERINSEKSKEMFLESKALYYAIYNDDESNSFNFIDQAIEQFPNSPYPMFTKFEICEKFNKVDQMKAVLTNLNKILNSSSYLYSVYLIRKSIYFAYKGEGTEALKTLNSIHYCPPNLYENFKRKIEFIINK